MPSTVRLQLNEASLNGSGQPPFTFTTAPAAGSAFRASVFGDWGYGENGNAVETKKRLEGTIEPTVDLFWHLGDIG